MVHVTDWLATASDFDIKAELKSLDGSEVRMTNWEAQFVESVVFKSALTMTVKQRETAIKIIRKYR